MRGKRAIALLAALVIALVVGLLVEVARSRRPAPAGGPGVIEEVATSRGVTGWRYETLDVAEREVVDRGRDVKGWGEVHDAFSAEAAGEDLAAR